jgi:hypothetical protein
MSTFWITMGGVVICMAATVALVHLLRNDDRMVFVWLLIVFLLCYVTAGAIRCAAFQRRIKATLPDDAMYPVYQIDGEETLHYVYPVFQYDQSDELMWCAGQGRRL